MWPSDQHEKDFAMAAIQSFRMPKQNRLLCRTRRQKEKEKEEGEEREKRSKNDERGQTKGNGVNKNDPNSGGAWGAVRDIVIMPRSGACFFSLVLNTHLCTRASRAQGPQGSCTGDAMMPFGVEMLLPVVVLLLSCGWRWGMKECAFFFGTCFSEVFSQKKKSVHKTVHPAMSVTIGNKET